jgi:uncharacterized protein
MLYSYFRDRKGILKFRVEDIGGEEQDQTLCQDRDWLEGRLGGETQRPFCFTGPIKIVLKLSRVGKVILMRSRIEADGQWICARCLTPFPKKLTSEFAISLKPRPDSPFPEEVELSREDLGTEFYDGEEVDVTPLIQDQILLTLPPKAICKEECRGLCPQCGQDLNQRDCRCTEENIDPRLEPLRTFRIH